MSRATLPAACTASQTRIPPFSWTRARDLRDRLQHPRLVIRQLHGDERRPGRGSEGSLERVQDRGALPDRREAWRASFASKRPPASTAACSVAPIRAREIPLATPFTRHRGVKAVAMASVPPLVKITPASGAFARLAIASCGPFRRGRAPRAPRAWTEEGLPVVASTSTMRASTSARIGAVAFQSR